MTQPAHYDFSTGESPWFKQVKRLETGLQFTLRPDQDGPAIGRLFATYLQKLGAEPLVAYLAEGEQLILAPLTPAETAHAILALPTLADLADGKGRLNAWAGDLENRFIRYATPPDSIAVVSRALQALGLQKTAREVAKNAWREATTTTRRP